MRIPPWAKRAFGVLVTVLCGVLVASPALVSPRTAGPWLAVVALFTAPATWAAWRFSPWLPTPAADRARLLEVLQLCPGDTFFDLGAGDGCVRCWVHEATGARCRGIELSPFRWGLARLRLARPGARLVTYRHPIPGLTPARVDQPHPDVEPIFTYVVREQPSTR